MRPNWTETGEIPPKTLVARLGEWSAGEGALYKQLADRLSLGITRGELPAGVRLPPERLLARALAVSRTTVVGAYDLLRAQGTLESRQGSGTWVSAPPPGEEASRNAPAPPKQTTLRGFISAPDGTIDLLGAHLPGVEGIFAAAIAAAQQDLLQLTQVPGYHPLGLPALRKAVAQFLTRAGLPTREDQVLITTGAQQAISLTAAAFLQPGDTVVVEDPTYVGAIDAFQAAGARVVSVRLGPDGLSPTALRETVVRTSARLVYLMPTFQNPTGAVMPETRRRDVARLAEELQVPVLEDNTLGDIVLTAHTPPPPIGAFTSEGTVLSVGSMSKLFWAGLRVGWIRAGEAALSRLIHQKVVADMGSSVPSQCLAAHVLAQSEKVKRVRRKEVSRTLDLFAESIARHLPGWTFARPQGGLVLWVAMPHGDAAELAQAALRHGVSIVPGSLLSPEGVWTNHVRFPLVSDEATVREGIERLGHAWAAYSSGARRTREMGVIV